jgi:hypothetical protein
VTTFAANATLTLLFGAIAVLSVTAVLLHRDTLLAFARTWWAYGPGQHCARRRVGSMRSWP